MTKPTIYQDVTARIIAQLEAGAAPWVRPWRATTANGMPTNLATKRAYQGINVVLLWSEAKERGFEHDYWLTYKQAQELGGQVRKGAKSAHITKYGTFEKENSDGDKEARMYLKSYCVFNVAEIDGIDLPAPVALTEHQRDQAADDFIQATGARIHQRGGSAFYRPSTDEIDLPELGRFNSAPEYYATALHELAHWTGAKSRLAGDLSNGFGSPNYAREELVAELAAAFLCASLQIDGHLQHAEYLSSWLRVLREDSRAIFVAAGAATRAADYLRAFSEPVAVAA